MLQAARLGLIGTIVVGVVAAVTTLIGTLVAPFLIRRAEVNAAKSDRRRQEPLQIVPDVVLKGIRGMNPNARRAELAASLEAHAKLLPAAVKNEEPVLVYRLRVRRYRLPGNIEDVDVLADETVSECDATERSRGPDTRHRP